MKTKILKLVGYFMAAVGATTYVLGGSSDYQQEHVQTLEINLPEKIASSQWSKEMLVAFQAAKKAGNALLEIQRSGENLQIEQKVGFKNILSPVTIADNKANLIICSLLNAQFPEYGILSEESVPDENLTQAFSNWRTSEMTWIIDPLDGTKDFINKGKHYGIHIGLTQNGVPVLGLNYYPETDTYYFAAKDCGAYKQVGLASAQQFHIPSPTGKVVPILNTDVNETAPIYQTLLGQELRKELFTVIDSCGLRICSIAEGRCSLYISAGIRGGIWDYCSGDVIISEAGGSITDLSGAPINYRSETGRLTNGSIVSNDPVIHQKVVQIKNELQQSDS